MPDLELATIAQLLNELLRRSDFQGVVLVRDEPPPGFGGDWIVVANAEIVPPDRACAVIVETARKIQAK